LPAFNETTDLPEVDPSDFESSDETAEIDFDAETAGDNGTDPEHPVYGSYDMEAERDYFRGGEADYYQREDGS
jgi:hypothetical protein